MSFTDWPWRCWRSVRGDAIALRFDEAALSWRALCRRVDALAHGFAQQGVIDGCGIALCAANGPRTLLAWLALLQCGARVLPLNPKLPQPLLDELLPGLTLRYGLALDDSATLPALPALRWPELPAGSPETTPPDVSGGHIAPADEDAFRCAVAWDPARLVSMTLTSGSSGLPKAAVHSAAAHLASAQGLLALMPYGGQDNWLLSLPLFHVSGQGIFWRWLWAGGCLTVRDLRPLHTALEGCTHASLVPTQLWRLLAQPKMPPALKSVLLGGAQIPVSLTQQAQARGVSCWCGYGLTELASTVCAKRADGLPDVGEALPGREVRVCDDEIQIRAASLACGYWRDGALVPLTDSEGWFHTRDRGVCKNGRLTVLGRLDNLFFSGGEGIQPEDVERVISAHPYVSQCFVVPIADVEFGQRPVAVVECDDSLTPDALAQWVADKLVRFQQPVRWFRLPPPLKNGGIKVSRRAVQAWVEKEVRR
ncbi:MULTISPECIES: o-succinylbenzoate--CoA ligase [Tenebrionibacter/Tenebrionicola group]|jgi:O-succinylbenzoic acid--CoA ligase|uniref:O-succinylbenzoate--CoA ligase n=2 Tax=Tenebrionibacter/Tenebrionicola group TaxID=2969848 RepID=A0A8K0V4R3_9ENTR|nr:MULTISPECIES: o-succinylbenzoate--CoA ligase [Tenebrionibacter/Tenebrionicola group]MBK4714100.1 o-succinylbenzoate--CoA ligase [Tenebrionibacter intestinalis]MBV5094786.1 o-succinylbenzoate--CoA ligase [Tenebrionicola larvae]